MATKKPAKETKRKAPSAAALKEQWDIDLRVRARNAYHEAYHEQERRTVDPNMKRVVAAALQHMWHRVVNEPFTPAPPTLYDAQTMAEHIQMDFVRQIRSKLEQRKVFIESFIEVARKSGREPTELTSETMMVVGELLELFITMPQFDAKAVLPPLPDKKS